METALLAEGCQLESFGGMFPACTFLDLLGTDCPSWSKRYHFSLKCKTYVPKLLDRCKDTFWIPRSSKGLGTSTSFSLNYVIVLSQCFSAVATVLVCRGELKIGTHVIAGAAHGKVRLLTAPSGSPVKVVPPGTAAGVAGWKGLPKAGDEVLSGAESDVRRALANRLRKVAEIAMMEDMEAINQSRREERERQEIEESEEEEETAEVEE